MWKELLIILLIIAMSYVFTITDRKAFDSQLIFIIAALFIVVIYNVLYYQNFISKTISSKLENFTSDIALTNIQTWLNQSSQATNLLNAEDQRILATNYQNVKDELSTVKTLLKNLNDTQTASAAAAAAAANPSTSYDRSSMLDLQTYQTMQKDKIAKLQDQLNNSKTTLNQINQTQNAVNYPKIPVYSSCIIADANGGYSEGSNVAALSQSIGNGGAVASQSPLQATLQSILNNGISINLNSSSS